MAKKLKDTDYLFISTYLRSRERNLLTAARMERMIDAATAEDAAKVLQEIGYGEFSPTSDRELSEALAREREELFADLYRFVPDKAVVDVFKVKYDYHNVKTLLKAQALELDGKRLLLDAGRVSAEELTRALTEGEYDQLPPALGQAAREAREVLSATGDPQLSDFVLDRAYFEEMHAAAEATGSAFLQGYVRLLTDATNLRSAVRSARMGKGSDFLHQVLLSGGSVDARTLASRKGGDLSAAFRAGALAEAAALGDSLSAAGSGELTAFERACDDAVMAYLTRARRIPFGEQAVVGYLYARENEFTAIRTILSGRMAGLDADTIRERLREAYV